jgi:cell division protein FtsZ
MRITVIATGIGQEETAASGNIHQFEAAPNKAGYPSGLSHAATYKESRIKSVSEAPIARGILRDPTEEELSSWNQYDNPVIHHRKVVGDEDVVSDYNSLAFDNNDLEVPTFLRRKAD